MVHSDVGSFLRVRREALRPADVGLVPGARRRTPGLRRSEVALLADVSVDYYERLERSRTVKPSKAVLASLSRALRLSVDERDYLYELAGYPPPRPGATGSYVDPAMMFLLDSLTTVPAHIVDDLTTVLAQNRLSHALIGSWAHGDDRASNVTWRWFTDPSSRALNIAEEHEAIGRGYAADLRAASAHRGQDPISGRLIADLLEASEEFSRYWAAMEVLPLRSTRKTLIHSHVGQLDVQCDFVLSSSTGHRLVIFRPQPGSTTADHFEFLDVLGRQSLED
ncbi:helix-turn-helix transcriptional regulator [Nonomuraea jiangxiensis]|uniref:Helix-turn-helix domain-containing protein n=1 Tax=Nonomuraea jiangxiensis TaxID=633440 RepID=A0A1G8X3P3_9ACTN|nr:helix-turn-helix transcriptional regulator [Nonomuraea jiangxiensis]SDJ84957.1 Helix-turn-helix domain-containing protein [Nonomuraea jiangxiensis]